MLALLVLSLCLIPRAEGKVCGIKDNCVCTSVVMRCRGFPGNLPVTDKTGVQLICDMDFAYDSNLEYEEMLSGFSSVELVNVPAAACKDPYLVKLITACTSTQAPPTIPVSSSLPPKDDQDKNQTQRNDGNDGDDGDDKTNVRWNSKALVITIVLNTAEISFLSCVVYQILVSLVYYYKRLNTAGLLGGRDAKPPLIIRTMLRLLDCCRRKDAGHLYRAGTH